MLRQGGDVGLHHTATLLEDGRVLIIGGAPGFGRIYDPATKSFVVIDYGVARHAHTVTLLQDGRVLVAGGKTRSGSSFQAANSAEIFDPSDNTWVATGSMSSVRILHAATLLPDGRVLVTGGQGWDKIPDGHLESGPNCVWPYGCKPSLAFFRSPVLTSSEIYDPTTGEWELVNNMPGWRTGHDAILLPDGRILVSGQDPYLFDIKTGDWQIVTTGLAHGPTLTLMPDGNVLLTGLGSAGELYDPKSGHWMDAGAMGIPRNGHTSTLLDDGTVLITGGNLTPSDAFSEELFVMD